MKTVDFSETIAASDLKVEEQTSNKKICEYRRSRSFLDLDPWLFKYKTSNWISSETTVPI